MDKHLPTVSVIMPAYNAERFIEEAIRSVMAQTVTDWELLVLDDGSTDSTADIVTQLVAEDARIRYLPNEHNMGVARTRNRGFDLCNGKYVALIDSDDVWLPDKLARQITCLEENKADIVCCSYAIVDLDGKPVKPDYIVPEWIDLDCLLQENVIGCSTVVFISQILETHRFHVDYFHEDYVLWLQLLRDGYHVVGCKEILAKWRFLENSRSFNKWKSAKNRWLIYRNYLGLPFLPSIRYFVSYALAGLRKYSK